ncbi:MAG: ABC transporter permease [Defluviitaleaceae bacterium]|nr:ABC transporter permease [Defluviitaleaceae bacterium]
MKAVKRSYLAVILIFIYAPIATLIMFSFNAYRSRGEWGGFSLYWYISLFNNAEIGLALRNTLTLAVFSALISTVIGTMAALGIAAMRKKPRKTLMSVGNIPVLNPEIVTGIALRVFFLFFINALGGRIGLGFGTLLMAHITFNISYVMLSVLPKVRAVDPSVYEAAVDLGASPFPAFMKVVFPQLVPGIVTGFIFAFTLSLDDFMISYLTSGNVETLSIYIFSAAYGKRGISPEINALSTLMFVALMVLLFIVNRRDQHELRKNKLKKRKELL